MNQCARYVRQALAENCMNSTKHPMPFLGFITDAEGGTINQPNIKAVTSGPQPQTIKELPKQLPSDQQDVSTIELLEKILIFTENNFNFSL